MTKQELIDYFYEHRITSIDSEEKEKDFKCKIESDLRPWFVERMKVLLKIGYVWSLHKENNVWTSVPTLIDTPIIKVRDKGDNNVEIIIEVDSCGFSTARLTDLSDLTDLSGTIDNYIEKIRTERAAKIDSLMIELGKELAVLEDIEGKIKEFGLEND